MVSTSGRFTITFNGEIYNYREILNELFQSRFLTEAALESQPGDTAMMLAAFEAWGIANALERFVGMFAFGVWDRETHTLTLARDRFGEKPLYYGVANGRFIFASELRPFKLPSEKKLTISANSLALFARYNCIPAPHSVFEEVKKLPPGHHLTLTLQALEQSCETSLVTSLPQVLPYYDIKAIAQSKFENRFNGTAADAVSELDRLVRQSVGQQMLADVPVGAFLSGGIDSSSIVAVMQSLSNRPVKTFSIGFSEAGYNEAPFAAKVAKVLNTAHTELIMSSADALEFVPQMADFFDEPFADSSQLPTYLVAKLARQQVTVSLSGDGGDELFGGYERYRWTEKIWNSVKYCPRALRVGAGSAIGFVPFGLLNSSIRGLRGLFPSLSGFYNPGDKLLRLAALLGSSDVRSLYHLLLSHWNNIDLLVPKSEFNSNSFFSALPITDDMSSAKEWMMLADLLTYLPDDILTKVDRASMAVSLESRVPFLDHRIVEFALSLPESFKFNGGDTKWVLRQMLKRYVPEHLFDRPKRGFSIPLDNWLMGPLKDWARDLLEPVHIAELGFFNPIAIEAAWEEHVSGLRPRHNQLWIILMFCAWHRDFFKD